MNDSSNTVGQSTRTYGKHSLLDKLIARECGVLTAQHKNDRPYPFRPYFVIDLCSGDGRKAYDSDTCSPEIIQKHIGILNKNNIPFLPPVFCERNVASFDHLKKTIKIGIPYNGDATSSEFINFIDGVIGDLKQFTTFIHNDPNLVTDWAISADLLSLLNPSAFTTFSTLGCNVGGIKRLPPENRKAWREKVDSLLTAIPVHHCAMLAALERDKSQWAYLVTAPKTWNASTKKEIGKAFLKAGFQTIIAEKTSQSKNDKDFYELLDVLTLTKKEREENDGIL